MVPQIKCRASYSKRLFVFRIHLGLGCIRLGFGFLLLGIYGYGLVTFLLLGFAGGLLGIFLLRIGFSAAGGLLRSGL